MTRIWMAVWLGCVAIAYAQSRPDRGVVPKRGFVPNAETAIAVAEAVLTPVYGKTAVVSERPFKATLTRNVWTVTGSVPCDEPPGIPCPGGAAEVKISRISGRIVYMRHYQ